MCEERVERVTVDREHIDGARGARRRHARLVADERHLAQAVAGSELCEQRRRLTGPVVDALNLAAHHEIEAAPRGSLAGRERAPLARLAADAPAAGARLWRDV